MKPIVKSFLKRKVPEVFNIGILFKLIFKQPPCRYYIINADFT